MKDIDFRLVGLRLNCLMSLLINASFCSYISASTLEFAAISSPGNRSDVGGFGSVNYVYEIAKHEVTNSQYTAMLNAVAVSDANDLYSTNMETNPLGGIVRTGNPGEYVYSVKPGRENHPVTYVTLLDSLRFANWLHNGRHSGGQDATTTEDGAYALSPGNTDESVLRKPGARFFIASENEWYKAAYYSPTTDQYFDYATGSNTKPVSEPPLGGSNSVNYWDSTRPGPTGTGFALTGSHTGAQDFVYFTDVGAYQNSPSPFGTFDQSGNVWEFTEGLLGDSFRGLRGGSWNDAAGSMQSSIRGIWQDFRDFGNFSVGFRIARVPVPEPTTSLLTILSIAFVSISSRRKCYFGVKR